MNFAKLALMHCSLLKSSAIESCARQHALNIICYLKIHISNILFVCLTKWLLYSKEYKNKKKTNVMKSSKLKNFILYKVWSLVYIQLYPTYISVICSYYSHITVLSVIAVWSVVKWKEKEKWLENYSRNNNTITHWCNNNCLCGTCLVEKSIMRFSHASNVKYLQLLKVQNQ